MKKILFAALLASLLSGCLTPEEIQENQRRNDAMSPLEKCIKQANWDTGMCQLSAMGQPLLSERTRVQQDCANRQMAMQDRCYARFK